MAMTLYEYYMVFPDGDRQEITRPLSLGLLFDMHGNPLIPPLPTHRMLVYKVCGKRTREERGITETYYLMEQLSADELLAYVR